MKPRPRQRPWTWNRQTAVVVCAILLVFAVQEISVCRAADRPKPVLVVPASKTTLEMAIDVPEWMQKAQAGPCRLVEVDRPGVVIPSQLVKAMNACGTAWKHRLRLLASIPPRPEAKGPRQFRMEPAGAVADAKAGFQFKEVNDASLGLWEGGKPVLVYNHGMVTVDSVPEKDSRRTRSSYIHPLWGLQGEVLTDDAPKDHYHHRGVFWAWPHVSIDGKEYDLWTYKVLQQKFVRWLDREAGPVAATLGVENGWFVGDRKVMTEMVWLRTYQATDGHRALDIEFTFIPIGKPVTLRGSEGKSYGGLNLRFAPRDNTIITVPTGPASQDLPDTPLAWADLTSKLKDPNAKMPSGAAIFVDPHHPDFPPTWLTRHYGILCVGWPGVKGKAFEPGVPIRLAYRIWVHNGAVDTATLQQAYDAYGQALRAEWK